LRLGVGHLCFEGYAARTGGVVLAQKLKNISTAFKEEDDQTLEGKETESIKASGIMRFYEYH